MALKRYAATSVTSGGASTITVNGETIQMVNVFTVPSSSEGAIVNYTINGGTNGGVAVIAVYRSSSLLDKIELSIGPSDCVSVATKEFLEAGDVLRFGSDAAGLTIAVSCDVSATA